MIRKLCKLCTNLSHEDIEKLENIAAVLPVIADLVKADVFIDCLTRDANIAIVVAEAKPSSGKSLYKHSVVGQLALRENEPAALRTLQLGIETRDLKAITQENQMVSQNVVPIKNDFDKIIGVLIMEQDVTQDFNESTHMDILSETAEQLTQTLMNLREGETEDAVTYHSNDAIVMFNEKGAAAFANPAAEALYKKLGYRESILGMRFDNLCLDQLNYKELITNHKFSISEIEIGKLSLQVKYAATKKRGSTIGLVMLIKDITEVKEKEKELILKSVAIREIHHRVKNNLQTIASLLRLQSRRIEDEQTRKSFNDSINRVLSIAVTHEILAQKGVDDVDIKTILSKIKDSTLKYALSSNRSIDVEVLGDSLTVNSDKATSIALVVNEILQNALEHAFNETQEGKVEVIIKKGIMYSNISIVDNGDGFDAKQTQSGSLGLNIVKRIVRDKLSGNLIIESTAKGTKVDFDFAN
jgi:two-component sensor histidine kinase/PAS domain-containing protein